MQQVQAGAVAGMEDGYRSLLATSMPPPFSSKARMALLDGEGGFRCIGPGKLKAHVAV
jgi:hypothetical protein